MDILATIGTVAFGVLLVVLGFSALIIVHEWGHFIAARLCGVRCEKFYIGFDFWGLKLCKFKWGDTEYGLGLFPFGGYLKMLGQEDNPGAIQAEIERAKLQDAAEQAAKGEDKPEGIPPNPDGQSPIAQSPNAQSPSTVDNAAEERPSIFAPDSYLSKSVPQRLFIIVAGVAMNLVLAVICGAGAYMIGVVEMVPVVGNVVPGSPAWEAGLQTGDRIVEIDGKPSSAFRDVTRKLIAGSRNVRLTVERQGETLDIDVAVRKRSSSELVPLIGILSQPSLELASPDVPSLWRKYYAPETLEFFGQHTVQNPLRLEKVDGVEVKNYAEYQEAQLKKIGQPITGTFRGTDVEIPAIPMRTIPVRFAMGEIVSVLPGSDAERQGIKSGDTIVSVDGTTEIDPLKLPQILLRKVNEGLKMVELVVRKADGNEQTLSLELAPTRFVPELSGPAIRAPLGSTAFGLSWSVEPVIAAVDELLSGQPAPAVGDRVTGVEFVNCEPPLRKNSFSAPTPDGGFYFRNVGSAIDLPYIFSYALQATLPKEPKKGEAQKTLSVRLTLESPDGASRTVPLPIVEATDWFYLDRGFILQPEEALFQANGWGDAFLRGTAKTADYTLLVYQSLKSLSDGTVSPRALNGPIGIIEYMYKLAQSGWGVYFLFLCLIGANLAVINLLPIPPLDGGHVVFLTYEGIFGRSPNELIQVILSYTGLLLIILLMVWTVTLDLSCIPRW